MSKKYQSIRVGDIDINYEIADYTAPWRTSPPETFLLYHGYCRNMMFWQQWVPLLATDYRVIRFDARGCGETSKPPAGSSMSFMQLAGDSIGLMDKLGIERVHFVGESSGGIVGMTAALTYPDRLSTLTLCDTPFKRSAKISLTYVLGEADRAAAFNKYGVGGWCRQTLPYRIDTSKASPELCEWYIAEMDKTPKHIANAMDRAVAEGDLWPRLRDIKTPTLILAGAKSELVKAEEAQAMQQQIPMAKRVPFDGFGHGVNLLAPERCVSEVREFLSELRGARS